MEFQEKKLVVNDQLINYYEYRDKLEQQCLVFLHGWRVDSKIWLSFLKDFGIERTSIYLIDLPGFGGSEAPRRPFNIADYAQTISHFINKLRLNNITLIGHSVGGRIAIKLGSEKGFHKIVLIDSAGLIPNKKQVKVLNSVSKLVSPLFRLPALKSLRILIYKLIGSEDYITTPHLTPTFLNIISEDLRPILKNILSPTKIIWGEDDKETPLEMGKIMQSEIPHAELTVIKNAGHFPFKDQPEKFRTALLKALGQNA